MTTIKVALEYVGYDVERLCAVGAECDALDLGAQTEHFYSSSPLDPIVSAGLGARYRLIGVGGPEWLLSGIRIGQADGRWYDGHSSEWWAANIALYGVSRREGWAYALRPLITKRGKFADSLREFFAARGYLTDKQASFV